jgi:hypothetical protein
LRLPFSIVMVALQLLLELLMSCIILP